MEEWKSEQPFCTTWQKKQNKAVAKEPINDDEEERWPPSEQEAPDDAPEFALL